MWMLPLWALALSAAEAVTSANTTLPYRDASLPISARVQDLVGRMTLAEKTAQLLQGDISNWLDTTTGAFNATGLADNMAHKAGSFYVGYPLSWDALGRNIERGQAYLAQDTRLGIPAFVQTEGIHGLLLGNATIFNSPLAQACSWNRTAVGLMAAQIGAEARALGVNQLFAPLADLARELRYGRVEETYGEDGHLAGAMAFAFVRGLQAQNVSAMVKHFAAYSAPEQGLNTGPVHGGERELRTTWLPSYRRAIIDAGALSVMSAYSSYDGVPAVADAFMLTDILRGEWGYEYFVMSDSGATDRLEAAFFVCPGPLGAYDEPVTEGNECIALDALPAGGDVEMGGGSFNYRAIPALVGDGRLSADVVDTAVGRLLRAKFKLGLFDESPGAGTHYAPGLNASQQWPLSRINDVYAKELARSLDRESIVLLQNDDAILPLSKDARIALVGPMAHGSMNYGDYVVQDSAARGVTPLDGLRAALAGHGGNVTYAKGCERWSADEAGFAEALETVRAADVAVVVVGTWSRDQTALWMPGANATTGEHIDVADLGLVGAMRPLVRAVLGTGVPTVVVFSSGKPVAEPWLSSNGSRPVALVQQFYPGQEGGHALADVLFGDHGGPSGKLAVSFPTDVGTLPVYYDYLNSGRATDPGYVDADGGLHFGFQYVLDTPAPWFPFGHGLSYTRFVYSNLSLSAETVSANATITAVVDATNAGARDGAEVVQLYVRDVRSSVVVPNMQLRGWDKLAVPAGATRRATVELRVADCGLWDRRMRYVVEPGEFLVMVGGSSRDLRANATFVVV